MGLEPIQLISNRFLEPARIPIPAQGHIIADRIGYLHVLRTRV
jgi:hypothetical protein